jgi:hypothetical protein
MMEGFKRGDLVVVSSSTKHGRYGIISDAFWASASHKVEEVKGNGALIMEEGYIVWPEMCSRYFDGVEANA